MPLHYLIELDDAAEANAVPGTELTLERDRAHYLVNVMRVRRGDRIACFDGKGLSFDCNVAQASSKNCALQITAAAPRAAPPELQLHVGLGLLKGQPMDRAIQQSVELGATRICIVDTQRSNVRSAKGDAARATNKSNHWRKVIQGACEQCGRLFLPEFDGPASLHEFISSLPAGTAVHAFDPTGDELPTALPPASRALLIGPEGGWSPQELQDLADRDVTIHRFGGHVVRAETAPGIALALIQQLQGWITER